MNNLLETVPKFSLEVTNFRGQDFKFRHKGGGGLADSWVTDIILRLFVGVRPPMMPGEMSLLPTKVVFKSRGIRIEVDNLLSGKSAARCYEGDELITECPPDQYGEVGRTIESFWSKIHPRKSLHPNMMFFRLSSRIHFNGMPSEDEFVACRDSNYLYAVRMSEVYPKPFREMETDPFTFFFNAPAVRKRQGLLEDTTSAERKLRIHFWENVSPAVKNRAFNLYTMVTQTGSGPLFLKDLDISDYEWCRSKGLLQDPLVLPREA